MQATFDKSDNRLELFTEVGEFGFHVPQNLIEDKEYWLWSNEPGEAQETADFAWQISQDEDDENIWHCNMHTWPDMGDLEQCQIEFI